MARITQAKNNGRKKVPAAIRTYTSALAFLNSLPNYEKMTRVGYNANNFNLSRMNRLLALLDNPQRQLHTVHIAGTKGKGSTATMLAAMVWNSGIKTGLYTSPHLVDVRERIQIDGQMIAEEDLTRLIAQIAPLVRKMGKDEPTFFEVLTALGFVYYVEQKVELAVIEVGLGGRLDSTNVLKPDVCAVTSISLDHVDQLGNTLDKIAEEKAGIFKPGVPIISVPQPREVAQVLLRAAERVQAPIKFVGKDIEFSFRFESSRTLGPHTRVSLTAFGSRFEHLPVPLPGDHQAVNCGLALSLMALLREQGYKIDDQKAIEGLAKARLPGRMEIVHENPRILLDGAHNAASVEALMRAIGQNISYDSMVVIFGCRSDKDVNGMLKHIQLGADKIIFTEAAGVRSVDPSEIAAAYMEQSGKMAQVARSLEEALDIAERAVTRDDLICITGSFYLVGRAKRVIEQRYAAPHSPQLTPARA